jgi:hypothetical protein
MKACSGAITARTPPCARRAVGGAVAGDQVGGGVADRLEGERPGARRTGRRAVAQDQRLLGHDALNDEAVAPRRADRQDVAGASFCSSG